jgi:hypothetical protein
MQQPDLPLSLMPSGLVVAVTSMDEAIDDGQKELLASYGISPGRTIIIVQQKPMTVVMAEDMEVALEITVSRHVWVRKVLS